MKLNHGDKFAIRSKINNNWSFLNVLSEETVYGYSSKNSIFEEDIIKSNYGNHNEDIYILHNLNGYAYHLNNYLYYIHGIYYKYEQYIEESKRLLRYDKLKRILNGNKT